MGTTLTVLVLLRRLLGSVCLLFLLFGTFGVWPLLPQQGPGTHGPSMRLATCRVLRTSNPHWPRVPSSSGVPARSRTGSFGAVLSSERLHEPWSGRLSPGCSPGECVAPVRRQRATCWRLEHGHCCCYHKYGVEEEEGVGRASMSFLPAVCNVTALIRFCKWPVCAWKECAWTFVLYLLVSSAGCVKFFLSFYPFSLLVVLVIKTNVLVSP